MPAEDQSALGCSKCRFSKRGCKRCRDPACQKRKRYRGACGEPQEDLRTAPKPADIPEEATTESTTGPAEHKPSAATSESPCLQPHHLTLKAPPPDSRAAPANHDPSPQRPAVTQLPPAGHDNTFSGAACAAALHASSLPTAVLDNTASGKADTAGTSIIANDAAAQHFNLVDAAAADHMPSNERPSTSSQGTASGSRPSFLLMLHSKVEQRRQQRRESQSASDSSLSSVHAAGVSSAEKAEGSVSSGTQAPPAMKAPQHKVQQHRRRSAKKPAKTRAFLQAGGDPREALWHPPASPYGLLEEVLYEDPWKLLVACMLLNVTSGLQVRKVIWRLFAIWPNAEAAAGASDDTLVIVEKLIQPLGLFRKRTMAIKRFSQEYLTAQWLDPIELHGIGQYASDAYFMFCRGNWQDVEPTDKDLLKFQQWLHSTGGEGTGLERDVMPDVCAKDAGPMRDG